MIRKMRSAVIVLAGALGLTVAAASPAFALGGVNHTEPVIHNH